jgi:hypothetical protein
MMMGRETNSLMNQTICRNDRVAPSEVTDQGCLDDLRNPVDPAVDVVLVEHLSEPCKHNRSATTFDRILPGNRTNAPRTEF